MARPRSPKTHEIKQSLLDRLKDGYHLPGQRFYSTRALTSRFKISYQTAHRLIQELCQEGHLERRTGSGTFIAGEHRPWKMATLIFHARAQRPGSFGERLFRELTSRLDALGVPWQQGRESTVAEDTLPVLWECPHLLTQLVASQRHAILLNDRPPAGLAATWVDSVATDDFSGGVVAAQLLKPRRSSLKRVAVFSGPSADTRSQLRVAGFQSLFPQAAVVSAGTWDGMLAAKRVSTLVRRHPEAVFCCNDRLAQAVRETYVRLKTPCPQLIGFDDAPVATYLRLTTVALPWVELVEGAANLIQKRLSGDRSHAAQLLYAPRPVVRD